MYSRKTIEQPKRSLTWQQAIPTPPPQAQLIGDGLYLIVGGLGGLGRSIISWMADRGAKSILTLSRSGAGTNQAAAFIDEMKYRGVSVIAKRCDISSEKQVKDVLSDLARVESTPPIRGVIHAAMALEVSEAFTACSLLTSIDLLPRRMPCSKP